MGLIRQIDDRRRFLDRIARGEVFKNREGIWVTAPQFVIAKKWASWYPFLFDIESGCYAILTREPAHNVTVIDPGFNFLNTLRDVIPIEIWDIRNVIVTHMHPDHCAGLEQFLTLAYESGNPCDVFLTETGYDIFEPFRGGRTKIHEMLPTQIYGLAKYAVQDGEEEITFEPFYTFHSEIGFRHRSLGLSIKIKTPLRVSNPEPYKLVLLGDTDGRPEYQERYLHFCEDANIVMCNIGSYSDEGYGTGYGHLLKSGAQTLISNLFKRVIYKRNENELAMVLLTEFGFEMASIGEITTGLLSFGKANKYRMILLLASSIRHNGPDSEKAVFAGLLHRIMVDALNEINVADVADACFHFGMFLLFLMKAQRQTELTQASLEELVDQCFADVWLEKDIEEYLKFKNLEEIRKRTSQEALCNVLHILVRASVEQKCTNPFETILLFCRKMFDRIRSLLISLKDCRSWTDEVVLAEFLRVANSARSTLLDEEGMRNVKSLSVRDNCKLAMICLCLMYSAIKKLNDDDMTRETILVAHETCEVSPILEACEELAENATREAKSNRVGIPVVPVDKGNMFLFGERIKIKLVDGQWARVDKTRPVQGKEGNIVFVSAD